MASVTAAAQNTVIDISGNNSSDNYVSYDKAISIPANKGVDVKMARYCYFSSYISGMGTLNLYAGGERCYLGTAKGAAWPNWTNFKGDIHIYPFPENSAGAGFYGVVLAHGGKSSSSENALDDAKTGKVNPSMANNHVTLHKNATICCEANSAGAGFRIGELNTEAGSTLLGYMKKQRAAYYLLGGLNTDATLAGTIKPTDYRDDTALGIVKEGTGTLYITGNQNYLSGSLRVLQGRVQIDNDAAEAKSKKLRGAVGALPDANKAVAFVFEDGLLGGTGSIGGTVDNYGVVEPGSFKRSGDMVDVASGTLTISNYATPSKQAHLVAHPASILRFKVFSATEFDRLDIGGMVKYSSMMQDFSQSDKMPVVEISLVGELADMKVGDELTLISAQGKSSDDWHFELKQPGRWTWTLEERQNDGRYELVLRLVSFEDSDDTNPDHPDNPDDQESTMGAFYDDGIDDKTDTKSLRYYAKKNGKFIGTAISTWKNDITNESLAETKEAGTQFNMLVAENEMKFDALEPDRGSFSYWAADNLVSFAQRHQMTMRGHCLVWHSQLPQWVSSDGKKNDKNWSRKEALSIMENHIKNVVGHFKGKVLEWDVVNECLDDDQSVIRSNPEGYTLRQNVWQRAIGEDYIDSAFVYAHRADPSALLYLNDYDVELQGKAKAMAFYNLAMRLKRSEIPIDGVGLQCHFSVGDVDSVKLANTISRFGEADMKCIITELDMGIASTTAANLEEQARCYRVITDIMLNNDNCPNFVIWGLKDNDSWRSQSSPLLYTSGLQKKPAYYAVRSALRHRTLGLGDSVDSPQTDRSAVTNARVFDLFGRSVSGTSLKPGVYISEGRKFFVR